MKQAFEILKKYFGYEDFRPGQKEIIKHILNQEDCLGIMPTGAGKSICYQVPSLIFLGVTIVISPLISLMKDQVDALNVKQISSCYINSTLSPLEYKTILQNISNGDYKIIYIAPERLKSENFIEFLNTLSISMITIDEAHCVSQWGHDFRPSYLQITPVISKLKLRPIVTAFTSTATETVKNDIIKILSLKNPFTLTTGFDRANLSFQVYNSIIKKEFVVNYIEEHKSSCGVIYCLTRKSVDSLYYYLKSLSYSIGKYHGGMSEKQRNKNQDLFLSGKYSIMIATNAFGMGIDKPNIRFVIHYNMPKDLEGYYQEAGRAGRDGLAAECILLFSKSDIVSNKFLINHGSSLLNHTNEYQKLKQITLYCQTKLCLRRYILEYFGEHPNFKICNYCSNCTYNNLNSCSNFQKPFDLSIQSNNNIKDLPSNFKLFSILKAIRLELSIKYKVPPFMIFHNKTLIEMTKSLPTDINSLLQIKGIGKYKAETYGKEFIFAIKTFIGT